MTFEVPDLTPSQAKNVAVRQYEDMVKDLKLPAGVPILTQEGLTLLSSESPRRQRLLLQLAIGNRAQPFWQQIWPKSRDLATPRIAESLARMAIAARGEFPAAIAAVQNWLQPIEHPHFVMHLLHESGLCQRFPAEALLLLNAVIANQQWVLQELGKCLDEIAHAAPHLAQDDRYLRLSEHFRRYG